MRITATFLVLVVHIGQCFDFQGLLRTFSNLGQYGLYFFFLITGFLACKWCGDNRFFYLFKKFIRLYPLYCLVLIVYIFIHTTITNDVPSDDILHMYWLRYIFMINSILPASSLFWKSIHAIWYVSVVWIFYIIHALVWPFLKKQTVLIFYYLYLLFILIACYLSKSDSFYQVNYFAFVHYFILGILAFLSDKAYKILLVIPFSLLLINTANMWLFYNTLVSIFLAFGLAFFKDKITISKIWIKKTISILDESTYSVYLFHPMLIDFFIPVLRQYNLPNVIIFLLFIVLLTFFVYISHFVFEKQLKRLYNKHLSFKHN